MAEKLDVEQISYNRRIVRDNVLDDSTQPAVADCDADWPERCYENMPEDRVGFIPTRGKK